MVKFTQEQLQAFEDIREQEVAEWFWPLLKKQYPKRLMSLNFNDQEGAELVFRSMQQAKKYMPGLEEDKDYLKWRLVFAELAFVAGEGFDELPWENSILTDALWHPFMRIDYLFGVFEVSVNRPDNVAFFKKLTGLVI